MIKWYNTHLKIACFLLNIRLALQTSSMDVCIFPHVVQVEQIASATFARGGVLAKLLVPFRVLAGIIRATFKMWRDKPAMVVGFGGYPSIPAMSAAWILRRPRILHEQNGVLGRVNQLFAIHHH